MRWPPSFNYPRRAEYFSSELETFLLMARNEQDDPLDLKGSFAGAMGYGRFMPSSYKQYAVDFNGDGHINLWDPVDAIGSVANYFKAHGWTPGGQVAVQANGEAFGLENGFKTKYSVAQLTAAGLTPTQPLGNVDQVSLLRLDVGTGYQYWYGMPNFYTITRYNHSTHYAMAVWQLGGGIAGACPCGVTVQSVSRFIPLSHGRGILQKHFATLPLQTRHLHLNRLSLLLRYNI